MARRKRPLKERILEQHHEGIGYMELMLKVFPKDEYPKVWRYYDSGGSPGCVLTFGRGLNEAGLSRSGDKVYTRSNE